VNTLPPPAGTAGLIRKPDLPIVIVAAIFDGGMAAAIMTGLRTESRFARLAGPIAMAAVALIKIARRVPRCPRTLIRA
jgi:hypothetical protein